MLGTPPAHLRARDPPPEGRLCSWGVSTPPQRVGLACGGLTFSFCTGPTRPGRSHYQLPGLKCTVSSPLSLPACQATAKATRQGSEIKATRCDTSLFKQVRSERVTSKGKERSGTLPAVAYAPQHIPEPLSSEVSRLSSTAVSSQRAGTSQNTGAAVTTEVLYRAGDLVFVRPVSGGIWVAQLSEPVVRTTAASGEVSFNLDRPKARYFVRTAELDSYPHAMRLWADGEAGAKRRLSNVEEAQQRAATSDGVHFFLL